jgi:hypothetical protein
MVKVLKDFHESRKQNIKELTIAVCSLTTSYSDSCQGMAGVQYWNIQQSRRGILPSHKVYMWHFIMIKNRCCKVTRSH